VALFAFLNDTEINEPFTALVDINPNPAAF
jgi:hypothetical protein